MLAANAGGNIGNMGSPALPGIGGPEMVAVNGTVSNSDSLLSSGYNPAAPLVSQSPANYSDSDSDEDLNEPPPSLSRAASFALNQSQEDLMASEIAGVIGSGGSMSAQRSPGPFGHVQGNLVGSSRLNGASNNSVMVNGRRGYV